MEKKSKILSLALLCSLMLLAASEALNVNAQGTATVVFVTSLGGTTDPSGTQTYPDGQSITMTATPTDTGFIFDRWIVQADTTSSEIFDNPATLTVMAGVTYAIQAVFTPVQPIPPTTALPQQMSTAAIVQVLASAGGTTIPPPGIYALADATSTQLKAVPATGYQFSHWSISGYPIEGAHGSSPFTTTPTDNPYTVDHGYGNRYAYQAVFVPTGSTTPNPSGGTGPTPTNVIGGLSMEWLIIIALVIILIIVIIALAVWRPRRTVIVKEKP